MQSTSHINVAAPNVIGNISKCSFFLFLNINQITKNIIVKAKDTKKVKEEIRKELEEHNICHAILETEDEACDDKECHVEFKEVPHHHHHHH